MFLTSMKSDWYVDRHKTDTLWSARGPMTDFAILLAPNSSFDSPIAPTDTVKTLHG